MVPRSEQRSLALVMRAWHKIKLTMNVFIIKKWHNKHVFYYHAVIKYIVDINWPACF